MGTSLSTSCIVWMTFARQSYVEAASEYLRRQSFYCLPIEKGDTGYILGFIMNAPALPAALQHA